LFVCRCLLVYQQELIASRISITTYVTWGRVCLRHASAQSFLVVCLLSLKKLAQFPNFNLQKSGITHLN
jgi:hypothetical protein